MQQKLSSLVIAAILGVALFATLGAAPGQGIPPTPEFFGGQVTIQGASAPPGLEIVACINSCAGGDGTFQSSPVATRADGTYRVLIVGPLDRDLLRDPITFHIVTASGSIQAEETVDFNGGFTNNVLDLTFNDQVPGPEATPVPTATPPAPTPTPPAFLPVTGDPVASGIPKLALVIGAAGALAGVFLLLALRRRVF